jgi:hypothetical protein
MRTLIFMFYCFSLFGVEDVFLKTPDLSWDNIIGVNVGIRPYRKTGVRLEPEQIQDKLIIHNYGYGDSGLTLCFGGSKEVLEILNGYNTSSKQVAILGAGVIGLAVAYDLLEQGYDVHIYADKWSPHLTSDVAGGIWSPLIYPEDMPDEKKELHHRMLEISRDRLLKSCGNDPEFSGVHTIASYSFKIGSSDEAIKSKQLGDEVVVHFDNGVVKHGKRVHELGIQGNLFMEDLFSKVQIKGAHLCTHRFNTLEDVLSLDEAIIINCTSLGARMLFNDNEFIPTRGQLIYFAPQEGIDYLFYQNIPNSTSFWISLYPWDDRIILGGVYERYEENAAVTSKVIDQILENGQQCFEELPPEGGRFSGQY